MTETTPNWAPLEANLAPELCAEFMWMFRKDGVEYYKHIQTRRYLQLTAEGRCTAQPFEDHWKFVSGRAGGEQHEFSC